ncbi:MAG: histidine kinase [Clostridiales bacterium]|jgi:signal transduction histidine kinase|nr:histidine kinase [Clostridiales bacterium]
MGNKNESFLINRKLRRRFIIILAVFAVVILSMWWVYQQTVFVNIRSNAEQSIELVENGLMMELDDELSRMTVVTSVLSGSVFVQDFLTEHNSSGYYEKAAAVSEIISKTVYPSIETDSIITITDEGVFDRFTGGISNEACEKLFTEIENGTIQTYSVVELDGANYFCLVGRVYERDSREVTLAGYVVVLSDTAKLRRAMMKLNTVSGIDSSIILDGRILLSTNSELDGRLTSDIGNLYESVRIEPVTGSHLSVAAAITTDTLRYAERMFITISLVSALALAVVLAALYRVISVNMVKPMIASADNMQIGLLQTQISAHFIRNVVDCIEGLAESGDTENTAAAARNLSGMLRSLNEAKEEIHTHKELEHLGYYTELMNIRSGWKYNVTVEMDDRLVEYVMPSHILQPIAENAMTHGMGNKISDCRLTVTGRVYDDCIVFEVSDNGVGMSGEYIRMMQKKLDDAGELEYKERTLDGVAIVNIQRRIRTRYGKKYGLTVKSAPGEGTTVTVRLPLIPYISSENEED